MSPRPVPNPLPEIVVLGTGGTIAGTATGDPSLPGYAAGVLGVDALLKDIPAVGRLATIHAEQVANIDSKDMGGAVWTHLALRVAHWLSQPQICACVITHGTDTLEETAYFLHLVHRSDKPVVLTAAMRPATALDADGPQNLLDAVRAAISPNTLGLGAICVLHGRVHGAHDVTKAQSRAVDAFSSGERGPLGRVSSDGIDLWRHPAPEPGAPFPVPNPEDWPRVDLLFSHAGADGALLRDAMAASPESARPRGIVIAGTGNGTVHQHLEAAILDAQAKGVRAEIASRVGPLQGGLFDGLSAVKLRVRLMLELVAGNRGSQ